MKWISNKQIPILTIFILLSGCKSDDTPDTQDVERHTLEFHKDISAGESFTKSFGSNYHFMLVPIDHGWFIQIQDNRLTEDISRLTPPFHFVPNARSIEGWHFRNSDNKGLNEIGEKNVNAPQKVRAFTACLLASPNAMDRADIISDNETMKTPAGTFKNCIRVEETFGIDPDEKCYKTYAPGVGLIQDEDLLLTGYSKPI